MERFDPLRPRRRVRLLDPQVRDLGWVSIFAGLSSEIVYPLFPVFITVVLGGHGLAALGKLVLVLAFIWPVALAARFIDRFGKGMRTASRDMLIAAATVMLLGRGRVRRALTT